MRERGEGSWGGGAEILDEGERRGENSGGIGGLVRGRREKGA